MRSGADTPAAAAPRVIAGRGAVVAATTLLVAGAATVVRAQPQPQAPEDVVELIVAGAPADADALALVARELLARLQITVRPSRAIRLDLGAIAASAPATAASDPVLARAWIDWELPGRATLYLLDPRRDRVLVRQVERAADHEELAREELGHILETACEGLRAGATIGAPRASVAALLAPPPPAAPAPVAPAAIARAPAPAPVAPGRWQLGVGYAVALLSPQARLTHGPEVALWLPAPLKRPRLGAWLVAQYRFPVDADAPPGSLRLDVWTLRALAALELPLSPRLVLRLGAGGGADVVRVEPRAQTPGAVTLDPPRTLTLAVATAAVALQARVARRSAAWLALTADLDPTGTRYVFMNGDTEHLALRPWPVRPALQLGVALP